LLQPRHLLFLHADRNRTGPQPAADHALRGPGHVDLQSLPMPREMHRRILRQRLLCDRGRPPFAVVVYRVGKPALDDGPARRLVHAFRRRARLSDEIGWFGSERIAMLLPATQQAGAHLFAIELSSALAAAGDRPEFEVFVL